jgi:hypothetical protein
MSAMALLLRPTKLASTAHARLRDWAIVEDGRTIGRIIEDGSANSPSDRRWGWSIVVPVRPESGIVTSGRAPTLSEAKADFRRNWELVRAYPAVGGRRRRQPSQPRLAAASRAVLHRYRMSGDG